MTETKQKPWYKEGLDFDCTGCGKCCLGSPGYVWVSVEEIEAIAKHLSMTIEDFSKKYVRKIGKKFSLIELPGQNYSCVFLKNNQCSIYSVRPKQCRTYPFWPEILDSKKNWQDEAKHCEGIAQASSRVPYEEIEAKKQSHLDS